MVAAGWFPVDGILAILFASLDRDYGVGLVCGATHLPGVSGELETLTGRF